MLKKIFILTLTAIFATLPFYGCKKNDELKTVELNEVTHSVFYTPLYVAMENGYFEEEGLKINLTNGGGADNSMTALVSGSANIGLMGPETVIYVKQQNKKDAPKVFGQLTQRDGSFLVSRKEEVDFKWENLKGKEILAGRIGGVPAMTFEYVMKEAGMFNGTDYKLNFDVQFNLMTSAFISGTADYCTVFEPTASEYEKAGTWHVVASVGEKGGEIPYTSFIALESYLSEEKETVVSFLKAIKKAHDFMDTHTELEIAESIVKQFPSTSINSIETSIKSYKKIDAWKKDLVPTEKSFDRLMEIMISAGELSEKANFNEITDNSLLKEAFG